jgi:hypothetical protein
MRGASWRSRQPGSRLRRCQASGVARPTPTAPTAQAEAGAVESLLLSVGAVESNGRLAQLSDNHAGPLSTAAIARATNKSVEQVPYPCSDHSRVCHYLSVRSDKVAAHARHTHRSLPTCLGVHVPYATALNVITFWQRCSKQSATL